MPETPSLPEACANATLDFMQAMTRFLIAEGRELDPAIRITPPQFRALVLMERNPGISLSELGAEMGVLCHRRQDGAAGIDPAVLCWRKTPGAFLKPARQEAAELDPQTYTEQAGRCAGRMAGR